MHAFLLSCKFRQMIHILDENSHIALPFSNAAEKYGRCRIFHGNLEIIILLNRSLLCPLNYIEQLFVCGCSVDF